MRGRWAALGALLVLAGCGDLPQPFLGRPGATAMRLAQPPPSRLAIPLPTASLLTESAALDWSKALADALVAQDLPARAMRPGPGDWRLILTAEVQDGAVVPTYTVTDPAGHRQGQARARPFPPAIGLPASRAF